jgi:SAM-dependent methyltransferase
MVRYPRAGASFALRLLEIVPGMRRAVVYRRDRYQAKQQLRSENESVGHALGDRRVTLSFLGRQFLSFEVKEGVDATADQFFLNRPVDDARHLIRLVRPFVEIRPGDFVFDPGCGAGRHLFHFVDRYGCKAVGVDIYRPAIDVAGTANWDESVRFHCGSSIEPGFLDSILPDGCDFVFINSWLNHVNGYAGYRDFAKRIVGKCRFLLVITSAKDRLDALFEAPQIIVQETRGGTQFALIRGTREIAPKTGAGWVT